MTCGSYIDVLFVVLMKGNPLYGTSKVWRRMAVERPSDGRRTTVGPPPKPNVSLGRSYQFLRDRWGPGRRAGAPAARKN